MKEALSNARLWEARYAAVESSRQEYRENVHRLATENDTLQKAVNQVLVGPLHVHVKMLTPLTPLITHCDTGVGQGLGTPAHVTLGETPRMEPHLQAPIPPD